MFFSENKFSSIGPIYYEYGSMVITFDSSSTAVVAYEILKHRVFEDKKLLGKNWRHNKGASAFKMSEEENTRRCRHETFDCELASLKPLQLYG